MKKHSFTIKKVETHLKNKPGVLTENSSADEDFLEWDISITATTKNNRVSTYSVKHNNTYNNDKICIELRKMVDGQFEPSGLGAASSEFVILTFSDDKNLYLIRRDKLIEYGFATKKMPVDKYLCYDKNNCQLAIFDRPALLKKCLII